MDFRFKNLPFDERKKKSESKTKRGKEGSMYVPLVIEKHRKSKLPQIKAKVEYPLFLVSPSLIVADIMLLIKKNLTSSGHKLNPSTGLFLYISSKEIQAKITERIIDLQARYMDTDGFLYVTYSDMEAYGTVEDIT
jgi:hypothetical protein